MCHGQKSRFIGDGHPTFNRNPYNGYINPYYWVDDHPLLYGNNGSLDPSTHGWLKPPTRKLLGITSYVILKLLHIHLPLQNQLNVGKHTSPMNPIWAIYEINP